MIITAKLYIGYIIVTDSILGRYKVYRRRRLYPYIHRKYITKAPGYSVIINRIWRDIKLYQLGIGAKVIELLIDRLCIE